MSAIFTLRAFGTIMTGPRAGNILKGHHVGMPWNTREELEAEIPRCLEALGSDGFLTMSSREEGENGPSCDVVIAVYGSETRRSDIGKLSLTGLEPTAANKAARFVIKNKNGMFLGANGPVRSKSAAKKFVEQQAARERIENLLQLPDFAHFVDGATIEHATA